MIVNLYIQHRINIRKINQKIRQERIE